MDITAWQPQLQHLLDTDAELVVTDPDGDVVFTAPLARAWRLDADDPTCLWLRPLAPPVTGDDGTTVFALSQCRPRGLHIHSAHLDTDTVHLELRSGQRARIEPAGDSAAEALQAWDTFVGARLSADEELALEELAEDSWTGRYA